VFLLVDEFGEGVKMNLCGFM